MRRALVVEQALRGRLSVAIDEDDPLPTIGRLAAVIGSQALWWTTSDTDGRGFPLETDGGSENG